MDILSPKFPQSNLSPERLEKIRQRFWRKVDKSGDCWLWTGRIHRSGYGVFTITPTKHHPLFLSAHRVAWELTYGRIPNKMLICHRCNNPRCVNPEHIYAGTPQDNMNDKVSAGHHLNVPRGRNAPHAKLTQHQVQEIRKKYKPRVITLEALGKEYGVSHETIRLIISNRLWKEE